MTAFLFVILGIGILFLWLSGHWFGWVLAFFPMFFVVQSFYASGGVSTPVELIGRGALVLIGTGIPCFVWGTIRQHQH